MDGDRFDRWTRLLAVPGPRRAAAKLVAAGALCSFAAPIQGRFGPAAGSACAKAGKRCGAGKKCCQGGRCQRGRCRCKTGLLDCAGLCRGCCDEADCGGNACVDGACAECPPDQRRCPSGACVAAAGGCCADAECTGGRLCLGGACGCRPNQRECQGACIPAAECCDAADCPTGASCAAGTCRCPSGQRDCGGACRQCCGDGDCGGGRRCCGGACVDVLTDAGNCGGCGRQCAASHPTCHQGWCCNSSPTTGTTCACQPSGFPCPSPFPEGIRARCCAGDCLGTVCP